MSSGAASTSTAPERRRAVMVCARGELLPGGGVGARLAHGQVAIFHLPGEPCELYAVGNYDPIGQANVLARGIVGDVHGEPVVASPLYKQHFSLIDGRCLEEDGIRIPVYRVLESDGFVYLVE